MCGILGGLNFDPAIVDAARFRQALDLMAARGPNATGVYFDREIALGHRRLAITDPSSRSNQPFSSPDGRWTISFAGEIYNFRELRKKIETRGLHFKTESDTEVLLNGFVAFGLQFLSELNGIWAFSIWDRRDRTLWLSRDYLGVKPLYLYRNGHRTAFASEIKPILWLCREIQVDRQMLLPYLAYRFSPDGCTPFRSHSSSAGHTLQVYPGGRV